MHPNIERAHRESWEKFFYPKTGLFYEWRFNSDADFPSVDLVSTKIPGSNGGRGGGLIDCCLLSGFKMEGILWGYRVSGDKLFADEARQLFKGLSLLGTVSKTKGFIPRGVAPGRTDYYPNSSVDQYTTFISGVWRYATSGLASDAEKTLASDMVVNACRLIESFHHDIPTLDMEPSIFGDLSALNCGRAERLLQFYRTAYALSGDRHWLDLYHEKMEEHDRARLKATLGPQRQNPYTSFHGVIQSQVSLRALLDMEEDETIRAYYRKTLSDHATRVMAKIDRWYEYTQPFYDVSDDAFETVWAEFWPVFAHRVKRRSEEGARYNVRVWYDYMKKNGLFRSPPPDNPYARTVMRPITCALELPMLWEFIAAVATVMLSDDAEKMRDAAEKTWPLLGGTGLLRSAGDRHDVAPGPGLLARRRGRVVPGRVTVYEKLFGGRTMKRAKDGRSFARRMAAAVAVAALGRGIREGVGRHADARRNGQVRGQNDRAGHGDPQES